MERIFRLASASAVGVALTVFAACATAQPPANAYIDMSTCRDISTQAEIDGVMQPIVGRACLQSDGTWVLVGAYQGGWAGYPYAYDYWPGYYWGGPVLLGGSFVFIDRFHHFHHFHHDRGFRPGGFRPDGFRPGMGGFHPDGFRPGMGGIHPGMGMRPGHMSGVWHGGGGGGWHAGGMGGGVRR